MENPFSPVAFKRFLFHVNRMLSHGGENEEAVLGRGWF